MNKDWNLCYIWKRLRPCMCLAGASLCIIPALYKPKNSGVVSYCSLTWSPYWLEYSSFCFVPLGFVSRNGTLADFLLGLSVFLGFNSAQRPWFLCGADLNNSSNSYRRSNSSSSSSNIWGHELWVVENTSLAADLHE